MNKIRNSAVRIEPENTVMQISENDNIGKTSKHGKTTTHSIFILKKYN